MNKLAAVIAAGITALAVISGCGGSDATSAPPTKAAYLEEVNKICSAGQDRHDKLINEALGKLEREGENQKLKEELVVALQEPYKETTEQIADLTPPDALASKMEALIAAREKATEKVDEDPLIVFEGHPYRKVEELAKASGAGECFI